MVISQTWLLALVCFGLCAHGLLLAVLLLLSKERNRLTITFTALLLVLSLILAEYFLSFSGLESRMPHLIAIKIPLLFLIGPLYFLWTRYKEGNAPAIHDAWHAIPFMIVTSMLLPYFLLQASDKLIVASSEDGRWIRLAYLLASFVHLLVYVILSRKSASSTRLTQPEMKVHLQSYYGFILLLTTFGVSIAYALLNNESAGFYRFLFILGIAMLINILSYVLLKDPKHFILKEVRVDDELQMLASRVQQYMMQEKPYLQKRFSKSDLALALDSNENYVSRAINLVLQSTFTAYINQFRVDTAKELLRDGDDKIFTVGLDSGFTNLTSFARVFKKHTSHTPAEYRNLFRSPE